MGMHEFYAQARELEPGFSSSLVIPAPSSYETSLSVNAAIGLHCVSKAFTERIFMSNEIHYSKAEVIYSNPLVSRHLRHRRAANVNTSLRLVRSTRI
jgi:hypothetical protein